MFYIGIDVSKSKLDCSLLTGATNNKRKSKVVINSTTGISDLLVWTNKQHVKALYPTLSGYVLKFRYLIFFKINVLQKV
jgi:hypothetical protein